MNDRVLLGTVPWLPAIVRRYPFDGTLPAERLAALRIAVALCFLADMLLLYAPHLSVYLGQNSLSEPDVFREAFAQRFWWSLLRWGLSPQLCLGTAVFAGVSLLFGVYPKFAAFVCWAVALSFSRSNPYLHNGGDAVRHFLLFLLIFTPSHLAWSFAAPKAKPSVHRWWFVVLVTQMCLIYFLNGIRKLPGADWRDGTMLHYVCHNVTWCMSSGPHLPLAGYKAVTWFTLAWEIGFPLFLLLPITRQAILIIGSSFHVLTFCQLEVGMFAWYSLCLYVPWLPWERIGRG